MGNEELKGYITELLPAAVFEDGGEWVNINIDPKAWQTTAEKLRQDPILFFNYLFCVTCIDWKTHLTMVYHLSSTNHRNTLVVKIKLDNTDPRVRSVANIWKTAEFHEREAYEMFGVNFIEHPDLRLLILPDGWEGRNPMRKDFEDPINMIRL
ncbi:MAG: NADH-quinone oxidoreductase subunit C [Ferruginibacter sp.]